MSVENANNNTADNLSYKYNFGARKGKAGKPGRIIAEEPHIKRRRVNGRTYYYLAQGRSTRNKEIILGTAEYIYQAVREKKERAKIASGENEQDIELGDE